ncbi:sigma factor-like helix-turn-helix DNA-binding protein [Kitasatospora sp. NPDC058218]|uniref:sigma factor-like helix-turn-helix DNA-binding protein n=1 Tax=Kitasatospora sp. NPDC058218 TaxID=3346385 RepID=UPI0036DBB053
MLGKPGLPARQRAVLILRDVLARPVTEAAGAPGLTPSAVNSALQRARADLAAAGLREEEIAEPAEPGARAVVDRYVAAFQTTDLTALAWLLA